MSAITSFKRYRTLKSFIDENLLFYLWGTSIVDMETKTISDINKTRIRVFINDGLAEICSRFAFSSTKVLVLKPEESVSFYRLTPNNPHIVSNFKGNLIKVLRILSPDGIELSTHDKSGISIVNTDSILIPNPEDYKYLTILYQAFPHYDIYGSDDEEVIELPYIALEALRYYVLAKVQAVGSMTEQQEAMQNLQLFEQKLQLLQLEDVMRSEDDELNLLPSIYGFW